MVWASLAVRVQYQLLQKKTVRLFCCAHETWISHHFPTTKAILLTALAPKWMQWEFVLHQIHFSFCFFCIQKWDSRKQHAVLYKAVFWCISTTATTCSSPLMLGINGTLPIPNMERMTLSDTKCYLFKFFKLNCPVIIHINFSNHVLDCVTCHFLTQVFHNIPYVICWDMFCFTDIKLRKRQGKWVLHF